MTDSNKIINDCKNEMEYPPTQSHMRCLAEWCAEKAINKFKQTDGNITILKYCNMKGVIINPKHYARCRYVKNNFVIEQYPNLNIHVHVGSSSWYGSLPWYQLVSSLAGTKKKTIRWTHPIH